MIDPCLGDPARLRPARPLLSLFLAVLPRQLKIKNRGISMKYPGRVNTKDPRSSMRNPVLIAKNRCEAESPLSSQEKPLSTNPF